MMMASITDCVVEGLKYPLNDIKKLLGFGVLFVILSLLSVAYSITSVDLLRTTADVMEATNSTFSSLNFSQLPAGDINMMIILSVIGFIVTLFILGYQYNIVKFSIDKRSDLPGFGDVVGMFINGVKYFIVTLAYFIIPAIIFGLGTVFVPNPLGLAMILISIVLFVIAYFLLIMASNNMIAHDSLKKAFDFRQILDNIANLGWGKYIGIIIFTLIVFAIIMFAAGIILGFISVLFAAAVNNQAIWVAVVMAIIEGLFLDSYVALFVSRVCGSIYRESVK